MMVIGWDAAPPALVFEQYRDVMPNLDRLVRQGIWGPLDFQPGRCILF